MNIYIYVFEVRKKNVCPFSLPLDRAELVLNMARERSHARPRDLVSCPVPLRMVDTINPVLRLDCDAAVFSHEAVGRFTPLGGFELIATYVELLASILILTCYRSITRVV